MSGLEKQFVSISMIRFLAGCRITKVEVTYSWISTPSPQFNDCESLFTGEDALQVTGSLLALHQRHTPTSPGS